MEKQQIRAAIYARVSTDEQEEEGTSLETQVEKALLYCKGQGYITDQRLIYIETYTGMLYRERPVLSHLREDARNGLFGVLVVHALDRFSRVQTHQSILLEELEYLQITFDSVTEKIDNSLTGKIIRSTMGSAAEVERAKILERFERARRKRAESGNLLGIGIATYGYMWNENRTAYLFNNIVIKIDEMGLQLTEEKVARRILALYIAGAPIRTIAMTLTNEGIPTRKGGIIWRPSTIRGILSNPTYTGNATAYKWEVVDRSKGNWKTKVRPEDEQVKLPIGVVPAVIDEETFEAIQRKLTQNKQLATRNNKNARDSLLQCGFVVCGHCGASMHVQHYKPTPSRPYPEVFYYCPNGRDTFNRICKWTSITTSILDEAVWNHAIPILEDFSHVAERLESIKQKDPAQTELPPILRRIDDVNRRHKNFLDLLNGKQQLDDDTKDMIQEQLEKLSTERGNLEHERQAVEDLHAKWEEVERKLEGFKTWCLRMTGYLQEATVEEKRTALELLGVKAQVWRQDHDPRYRIEFAAVRIE